MRVGLDAHMVGHGETGNESYTANLLLAFERCQLGDTFAYFRQRADWPAAASPEHVRVRTFKPSNDIARLTFSLTLAARADRVDVLHFSYHAPVWTPCPFVVTVHDISFKRFPEFFAPRDRLIFRLLMPGTLRRAAIVFTGSENTRRDLSHFFPEVSAKIIVTPYAVGEEFRRIENLQAQADFCARYGIQAPFLLALGSINPRKNLQRLIQAWDQVQSACGSCSLVIAGPLGFRHQEILQAAQAIRNPDRIRFAGPIAAKDLPLAYNAAHAFIYPSLYEGFGLPVLESMACGTPVITSDASSIPEVAGDAALLFDPTDVDAIAAAMIRICGDADLGQELRKRGLERASQFSWSRTAQLTWQAYNEVK